MFPNLLHLVHLYNLNELYGLHRKLIFVTWSLRKFRNCILYCSTVLSNQTSWMESAAGLSSQIFNIIVREN